MRDCVAGKAGRPGRRRARRPHGRVPAEQRQKHLPTIGSTRKNERQADEIVQPKSASVPLGIHAACRRKPRATTGASVLIRQSIAEPAESFRVIPYRRRAHRTVAFSSWRRRSALLRSPASRLPHGSRAASSRYLMRSAQTPRHRPGSGSGCFLSPITAVRRTRLPVPVVREARERSSAERRRQDEDATVRWPSASGITLKLSARSSIDCRMSTEARSVARASCGRLHGSRAERSRLRLHDLRRLALVFLVSRWREDASAAFGGNAPWWAVSLVFSRPSCLPATSRASVDPHACPSGGSRFVQLGLLLIPLALLPIAVSTARRPRTPTRRSRCSACSSQCRAFPCSSCVREPGSATLVLRMAAQHRGIPTSYRRVQRRKFPWPACLSDAA